MRTDVNRRDLHAVFGRIVNVSADEIVLSEKGKNNPKKLNARIVDRFQGRYHVGGEQAGKAWNAWKKLMKKEEGDHYGNHQRRICDERL